MLRDPLIAYDQRSEARKQILVAWLRIRLETKIVWLAQACGRCIQVGPFQTNPLKPGECDQLGVLDRAELTQPSATTGKTQ
jgi:hypothetical protein